MNVVLIPFFLAANVTVNDVSKWTFGPEYSYHLNTTFNMKGDALEDVTVGILQGNPKTDILGYATTTIKCRPKEFDVLLCYLGNITIWQNIRQPTTDSLVVGKSFGIKFNEHGVENLEIEPPFDINMFILMRDIANQFNMDINEMRNNEMQSHSENTKREDTILGKCMTNYVIERKEVEANQIKENANFQLEVLPMPGIVKPEMTLSISKIRRDCINLTDLPMFDGIFKLETFNTELSINNEFKTLSLINGTVSFPNKSSKLLLDGEIMLNLESIKPASHELPSTFHGEVIDVNADVSTGILRSSRS